MRRIELSPVDFSDLAEKPSIQRPARRSSHARSQLALDIIKELIARKSDALNLYRPLPNAQRFHSDHTYCRLLIGSNRAGKTLTGSVEVLRALTGRHGYLPKTNGRCIAVGRDGEHVGEVMWKKLRAKGAFLCVPDERTGLLRAVRTDPLNPRSIDPVDQERKELWVPSPPLLADRFIREIAWEDKRRGIPRLVKMTNGWECLFCSSNGEPKLGVDVDLVWFDEEIQNRKWYPESMARLVDRMGLFIWTATPQAATHQLAELHELAMEGKSDIREFTLLIEDNPYIDEVAKRRLFDSLGDEEERRVRYYGEYAASALRVYPEYDPKRIHGCEPFDIPQSWTRYMVVDPGHQVCAVLFAAVPPENDRLYVYKELYMRKCTAAIFAERVAEAIGRDKFEAFIIDGQMARQTEMGIGKTIATQYRDALEEKGVASRRTGHGFFSGSNDTSGRVDAVRKKMRVNVEGHSVLQVFVSACQNLDREIKGQYYNKSIPDKRARCDDHAVDCLEYLCAFDPQFVHNASSKCFQNQALVRLEAKRKKQRWRQRSLGPTIPRR